ncbi:MAG: HlyD family efflux transporter periplasmic adaptor subunit [Flavobacteriaceae bacterium]|nr:HlyD family efflux transporter periplasmic adaptor subunit [Flavobacteriaceae bacterium]NVJ72811.1 HlyD family efflux transporter periplasmic adaptor subunit [Flavobacteriaceae bacterium]
MDTSSRMNQLRKIILAILGIVIVVVSVMLSGVIIDSKPVYGSRSKNSIKEVYTQEVVNQTIKTTVPANGVLVAYQRVTLTSRVQGVLQQIDPLFKAGQTYQQGTLVYQIDDADYRASVRAARANFLSLLTSILPDLQLDFSSEFDQWSSFLSQFSVEQPVPEFPQMSDKLKLFISGKGVLSSYYNLQNMEQNLAYYRFRAPFTGVLIDAQMTEGSLIRPGQQMGVFIKTGLYELSVQLPKTYVDFISEGSKVVLHSLDGNQQYSGTINRINAAVDAQTQSVQVFILVEDDSLREGVYLNAQLDGIAIDQAFSVKRGLLNENQQLFIVEDEILKLKQVEVLYYTETHAIVRGIEDGVKLLAIPVLGAYEGMEVKSTPMN